MKQACIAVNHFLRKRFPCQTWTSIAILYNPSMPLHRDVLNMFGHANHGMTLGNFMEGRVWIEDENGQATALLETKSGQQVLRGTWVDMHDKSVSFNARKYHMLEKHSRKTCGLLPHTRLKHTNMLMNLTVELGFPRSGRSNNFAASRSDCSNRIVTASSA
eukprot:s6684_g1.t1